MGFTFNLYAQNPQNKKTPPAQLLQREISGIVKDTTENKVFSIVDRVWLLMEKILNPIQIL